MNYTLEQIASILGALYLDTYTPKQFFSEILTDSRDLLNPEQSLFFALKTRKGDGHKYIKSLIAKGVKSFVVSNAKHITPEASFVLVKDTHKALLSLAKNHRKQFNGPIIAITGSKGKTQVKEWLYHCLQDDYKIVKTPKSYNSQIGVPISLWCLHKDSTLGIIEVGISASGQMQALADVIEPEIGIFTGLETDHLENFPDKAALLAEKALLFDSCKTILYNSDDVLVDAYFSQRFKNKNLIRIGQKGSADYKMQKLQASANKMRFELSFPPKQWSLEIPFTNTAFASWVGLVFSTAYLVLKISGKKIQKKVSELYEVEPRITFIKGAENALLIQDTFSLDSDSFTVALQILMRQPYSKKAIILSPLHVDKNHNNSIYQIFINKINDLDIDFVISIGTALNPYKHLLKKPLYIYENVAFFLKTTPWYTFNNTAVLIKGDSSFLLHKIVESLTEQSHDTVLEIYLKGIRHNYNFFKHKTDPKTKFLVMVKAFSYGTGYLISSFLSDLDYFGVAYCDEGIALRKIGIDKPIMVMNPEQSSYQQIIMHYLEPSIYSFRVLENFMRVLQEKESSKRYPIHIKIDSGMHRLGFDVDQIHTLTNSLKQYAPWVYVASIFSHLSASEDLNYRDFTLEQIRVFNQAYDYLSAELGYKPIKHIANSAAIINYPEAHFDMVRLGLGIYGYIGVPSAKKYLQAAVALRSVISQIKEIRPQESVGYGRAFMADKPMRIATIPVGYADGIHRGLGQGKGYIHINQQKAPIIGNVCMDMLMVDVTHIDACAEGDRVTIMGDAPDMYDMSQIAQTIPYEILACLSRRIKRVYIG